MNKLTKILIIIFIFIVGFFAGIIIDRMYINKNLKTISFTIKSRKFFIEKTYNNKNQNAYFIKLLNKKLDLNRIQKKNITKIITNHQQELNKLIKNEFLKRTLFKNKLHFLINNINKEILKNLNTKQKEKYYLLINYVKKDIGIDNNKIKK